MKAKRLLCILALVSSAFGFLRAQGRNVCFEAGTPGGNASSAEIYSGIEKGGFRPGYSSSDFWRAGAAAKTRGRFGKSFMTGSFSFEELHGKDMMTSMFINPGYYPIDVLEFTPGDKTLQSYRFDGGIAHPIGHAWSLGGRIGFVSQNYAKRKDIRHTNYGLDFSVVPSVLYRIGSRQRLGLSLVFRKTSESIEAEQVGSATADTYYAFFDKGLRYGTYQAWDGSGIHLAEAGVNRLPVREYSYGAALQYGYGAFYADAEYLRTSGLVGEKGYDWYRFPGHKLAANLSFQHRVPGVCGGARLMLHVDWRGQRLEEAAWDKVTSGGITLPEVYGYNTVSRRRQLNLMPSWQLSFNHLAIRSVRVAYAGIIMDEHASPQYPYTDRWHLWMSRLELTAVTGLPFGGIGKRFTLTLGARGFWAHDSGQGLEAGEAAVEPAAAPFRLSGDWIRKHEYMTSSGMGLNGSLAYAFHAVRGLSLSVDASWTHAFEIEYLLGKNRWTGNLHLGYAF